MFVWGGGGGVGACSFGRRIGIKFFFGLGSRLSPAAGAAPTAPMRPEAETAGRGQPRPWSTSLILTRAFDVDTLDRVRRSTPAGVLWSSEGPYVHTLCKVSVALHSFLPGELSFQWSMKRLIQATLTGEAFKAKPVYGESSVGSGNQTLYCEFVDAFCRVSPRARAVAISEAQDEAQKLDITKRKSCIWQNPVSPKQNGFS